MKAKIGLFVISALIGVIGAFWLIFFMAPDVIFGFFGSFSLFFPLFVLLSWISLPSIGVFSLLVTKGEIYDTLVGGAIYGIKIGIISLIIQLIYLGAGIAIISAEYGIGLNENVIEFAKRILVWNYFLLGVNLSVWGVLGAGGGAMALNALQFVTSLANKNKQVDWLKKSDWRSAIASISAFILILISTIETKLLSDLLGFVFKARSFEKGVAWIAFLLVLELLSLMFFALSMTIECLQEKKRHIQFFQRATYLFGLLTLLSAILLRINVSLLGVEEIYLLHARLEIVPTEIILFTVFISLVLLWIPRPLANLPKKYHKTLHAVAIWIRIIFIPVSAFIVISFLSPYYLLSATKTWAEITFGILGLYYFYIGLFLLFSRNTKIQTWLNNRVGNFPKEINKREEKSKSTTRAKHFIDVWLSTLVKKKWWLRLNLPQNPSAKLIVFGIGSWLLSKMLDSILEWFVQNNVIPLFLR